MRLGRGARASSVVAVLALFVVVVTAVTVAATSPLDPPAGAVGLRTTSGCDELAEVVEDAARAQRSASGGDVATSADAMGDSASSAESGAAPPLSPSTTMAGDLAATSGGAPTPGAWGGTNLQEATVDEADVVKTDGARLLALAGGSLRAFHLVDGLPVAAGTLALADEGSGATLLVHEDTAVVLATTWRPDDGSSATTVTSVDVSDLEDLQVRSTLELDGHLVDARLADGIARVVTSSAWEAGPAIAPFRQSDASGDVVAEGPMVDCAEVYVPAEPQGPSMVHVSSVALGADGDQLLGTTSVLGAGDTVYASPAAVYVATPTWDQATGGDQVGIHRFASPPGEPAAYEASGTVEGTLLGQFALSEHQGDLRVATTIWPTGSGRARDLGDSAPASVSRSAVIVLRPDGEQLVEIGRVDGLGPDESVHAVRFMGDVGYVVTFRQTDPLYTIDLSDPTAPRAVGELKILGYSAYLHPIGEGRLLGVGQDASARGQRLGLQVSLFDVSDLAAPVELDKVVLPGSSSEVEQDHHAFTWWAEGQRAFVPVVDVRSTGGREVVGGDASGWPSSALAAFDVAGSSVEPGPSLAHPDAYDRAQPRTCGPAELCLAQPPAQIRRSLVVDGTLLSLSDAGVLASDPSSLAERAWVPFA